ncbi:MAG: hypothetical protein ACHWZW_03100 [Spirulina sp.]
MTVLVVVVSLGSAGVLSPIFFAVVDAIQPASLVFAGMWNGALQQAGEAEALMCNKNGENCRIQGGQPE